MDVDALDDDLLAAGGRKRSQEAQEDELVGVRKKRAVTFDAPAAPEDGAPQGAAPPQGALARSNSDDFQENDGVAAEDDDSDDDDSDEDFGGLATDKEDRKRLRALPELEREMELSKRAERRDKESFRKMLVQREQPASKAKAQRAPRPPRAARASAAVQPDSDDDVDDSDDDQEGQSSGMQAVRRSARQQTQAHKSADKLETLRDMKASRERQAGYGSEEDAEARLSERQRAALRREIADLDSSGEEGGGADEGASEGEGARSGASDDEPEGGDEAPLEDIMAMQVKRMDLEDWKQQPNLDETLLGAVVRVALRSNESREAAYDMCLVQDMTEGAPYTFHGAAGAFETERYLVIVNPSDQAQHTISFALVSNTDLRREEFDAFHTARATHGIAQVTKREALSVARKLQQARNYTLSADDIGRILKEKREKGLVKRSLAMMKADLVLKRNAALEVGDDAAAAQAEEELQKLAQKQASRQAQQQGSDRLHALNRKVALENRARAHAAKKPAAGVAGKAGEPVHDPYARKATKVVQYWSTGRKESAQQAAALKTEAQQQRVKMSAVEELAGLEVTTSSHCGHGDKILARRLLGPQYAFTTSHRVDSAGKKVISLEQYQQMVKVQHLRSLGLG